MCQEVRSKRQESKKNNFVKFPTSYFMIFASFEIEINHVTTFLNKYSYIFVGWVASASSSLI
jgi:hypothetical protein